MAHIPYYGEDWDILTGRRDDPPAEAPRPRAERPAAPAPREDEDLWAYA